MVQQYGKGVAAKGLETRSGAAVKNQDLWQFLLGEIELQGGHACTILADPKTVE
jgi:hypothetical protein